MIPGANPLQYSAAYAQMLGLAGFTQQQQSLAQAQAGRVSAVSAAANPYAAQAAALTAAYGQQGLQTGSAKALTQAVNVKFKNLPFYDIHGELLKPTSLVTQGKRVILSCVSRMVTEESLSFQEVPDSRRLSSSSCLPRSRRQTLRVTVTSGWAPSWITSIRSSSGFVSSTPAPSRGTSSLPVFVSRSV